MHGEKQLIGFKVEVIVEPDEDGFHAYCPALKGLHTCGDTKEEALSNAKNAAIAYLESSIRHGDSIPIGILIQREVERTPHSAISNVSRHTEDVKVACAIS